MAKKMLFNATEAEESRVAILVNGVLNEYSIERASLGSCLGNIYKGKVTNIEPSIDAAFIEFGGARHGFLHASDVMLGLKEESERKGRKKRRRRKKKKKSAGEAVENEAAETLASNAGEVEETEEEVKKNRKKRDMPIGELLTEGQTVIVQVSKDGINDKAPTLTTYISLPGRFLVYMPGTAKRGISRKIDDENERSRLKKLQAELEAPEGMGLIIRTAGAEQTKGALQKDIRYLNKLWKVIQNRNRTQTGPCTLYQENDLAIRALRDLYSPEVGEILVDSEEVAKRLKDFMKIIMPRHVDRVKLYQGKRPLFDHYNIEKALEGLYDRRIPLESGGSLVIEQTEALVAIDVNSGRFKADELEETAFKINKDAALEIARQLKLRDLGGLIINDFIDMKQDKHRREVEKTFRDALKGDRARIKVAKMSTFGLIEMTRQRVRPSLKRSIFEPCGHCGGTGYVPSMETAGLNIIRKIRLWITQKHPVLNVEVAPQVAQFIQNHKRKVLLNLEETYGKTIVIQGNPLRERHEIRLLDE